MAFLHIAAASRGLAALVAACLAAVLGLLATIGLEEWFFLLGLACVICLLPVLPALLGIGERP
jgi:hypothetical protein